MISENHGGGFHGGLIFDHIQKLTGLTLQQIEVAGVVCLENVGLTLVGVNSHGRRPHEVLGFILPDHFAGLHVQGYHGASPGFGASTDGVDDQPFDIGAGSTHQRGGQRAAGHTLYGVAVHFMLPNNFTATMPNTKQALKAVNVFKDEYLLDFINIEELDTQDEDLDERILEKSIVDNIKRFILTFGQDFIFIGNQYRVEVSGEEMFVDLLFFNRELNSLVAVELKSGKFRSSYLGQLSTYLSALDSYVRKPHENPSIGILLCRDMNQSFVEFAIRDYDKPMGVAVYRATKDIPERLRNALPDIEELKKLL